jgi:hypothetical protein
MEDGIARLRTGPPDFSLFKHLWRARLISDLDLEELMVDDHRLSQPPLTRTQKRPEIRRCLVCSAEFVSSLPILDDFRVASPNETEDNCHPAQVDVFGFIRQHREAYRDSVSAHAHISEMVIGPFEYVFHHHASSEAAELTVL